MSDSDRMEDLVEDIEEAVDDLKELVGGEEEVEVVEDLDEAVVEESPKQRWIKEHSSGL